MPEDLWLYGLLPASTYMGLILVRALIPLQPNIAPFALGLMTIGLLLIAINNAWDLASWLSHPSTKGSGRAKSGKPKSGDSSIE